MKKLIILFFFFIMSICCVNSFQITDYYQSFDKSWNRFYFSNIFVMKFNFYVSNINIIYPVGLVNEKINKTGVRYTFFYLLTQKIKNKLEENSFNCQVELEIENDYVNIKITVPYYYNLINIFKVIKDFLKLENINLELNEDTKEFIFNEAEKYYKVSFNSVLWYFRQNIFASHPYAFLSHGNPKNILHLTQKDIQEFIIDNEKINPYFLVILGKNQDEEKVYNYLLYNFNNQNVGEGKFKIKERGWMKQSFESYDFLDKYYYRKVEVQKTRIFSNYVDGEAAYFLYLFTAPEYNKNFNEFLAVMIIDNFLSDPFNGVMWQELREKKGLIYTLYSEFPVLKYTSYYVLFTACYKKNSYKLKHELTKIIEHPSLTDENISLSKQRIVSKNFFYFSSPDSLSRSLIYSIIYKDKRISPFFLINYIITLDNDLIREIYKKYFTNYCLFVFE